MGAQTERQISAEKGQYDHDKDLSDGFKETDAQLIQIFVDCIDEAYHSGTTALGQKGYGNLSAREIIFRLFHLYGRPTLSEIKAANRRLAEPMDRMAPIEVMLRSV